MPATSTITFTISPLPTGTAVDANQYAQLIASSLQATLTGNFLTGQIDGTPPTQNIGVWLNQGAWYIWDPGSNSYVPQTVTTNPPGTILMYAGTVAPTGYLFCDGTLYLRSSFQALYNAISNNGSLQAVYGPDDGVSTFRVPDFRGRTPVGAGTGTTVIGANLGDLTPRTAGAPLYGAFGEEKHTLVIGETPSHFHGMAHTHTMANHTHVGANHQHDLQNHTHVGANHQHDLQNHQHPGVNHLHGDDHAHNVPGGQFNHHHFAGYNPAVIVGLNNPAGILFGANGLTTQNTGDSTLPAGVTDSKNTAGYGATTGGADRDLTVGFPNINNTGFSLQGLTTAGPSINNTGFSLQGLTTSGPNNNSTDPTTKTSTDPIGGSGPHENMQPSMVCHFIVKT